MNDIIEGYNPFAGGLAPPTEHQFQQHDRHDVYPAYGYYDESSPQYSNAYLQPPAHAPGASSTDAQVSGTYGHHAYNLNAPPQGPGYIYTFPSSPVAYFQGGLPRETEVMPADSNQPHELEGLSRNNTASHGGRKTAETGAPAQIKKPRAQRTKKVPAPEASGKAKPATGKSKKGSKSQATGTQSGEQQAVKKATKAPQACLPCQINNKTCTKHTFHECSNCIKNNMMCDWDDRYAHFRTQRKGMNADQNQAEIEKTQEKTVITRSEAKVIRPLVSALKRKYPKGAPRPPIRIARPGKAWFASDAEVREHREALALLSPSPPPDTPDGASGNAVASTSALTTTAPASVGGGGSTNTIAGPSYTYSGTVPSPTTTDANTVESLDIDPSLSAEDVQPPYAAEHYGVYQYGQQQQDQQGHQYQDSGAQLQYHHAQQQQDSMALPYHGMSFPNNSSCFPPFAPGSYPPSSFDPGYLSLPGSVWVLEGTMALPGTGEGGGESSDEEGKVVTPAMGGGALAGQQAWERAGMGVTMGQGQSWWTGDHAAGAGAAVGEGTVKTTFPSSFAYPNGPGLDLGMSNGAYDASLVDYERWSGGMEGCGAEEERVRE